ncbi:hypothetical protein BD410DRAFT_806462 [Rickenella mellea]|uniref:Uncharacterized protein n=1 Tax=Rickenella mellea TaxID=50990 RepID=A0A4Y7PT86_9AGAM|nr:hypothetical protein BD410DRAFT_806462 [Rickenella mellea]
MSDQIALLVDSARDLRTSRIQWDSEALSSLCTVMLYFRTWSIWLFTIPMQVVLTFRTLAIWERNVNVAILLAVSGVTYNLTILVGTVIETKNFRCQKIARDDRPNPTLEPLQDCYSGIMEISSTVAKFDFGALMIFDCTKTRARVLGVLLRDVLSVVNLLLTTFLPLKRITLMGSLAPALVTAQSIGASHIILNLRSYFSEMRQPSEFHSGMSFAERPTILDELSWQRGPDDAS